jgi:hypothetical protein
VLTFPPDVLAVTGYLDLRRRVLDEGPSALDGLYRAARYGMCGRLRTWNLRG